jgi:hypothetical protein
MKLVAQREQVQLKQNQYVHSFLFLEFLSGLWSNRYASVFPPHLEFAQNLCTFGMGKS